MKLSSVQPKPRSFFTDILEAFQPQEGFHKRVLQESFQREIVLSAAKAAFFLALDFPV